MIDPGLAGRVVLISGANNLQGIGAATARAFARQGARVAVTYRRMEAPPGAAPGNTPEEPGLPLYHALRARDAGEVIAAIREVGDECVGLEADLSQPGEIPRLFDWVESTLGPVEVLVNNAAHYEEQDTVFTTTAAGLDRTFAVNARATALMSAEYVRRYQAREASWGRIINLSTDAARAFAGQIAYGASKAAVEALTRSVAIEVGPLGITVNAVAPGPVQTGYIPRDLEQALLPSIPLRRIGTPEEIANVILFLASEQARWMTGQVVQVAGGHAL